MKKKLRVLGLLTSRVRESLCMSSILGVLKVFFYEVYDNLFFFTILSLQHYTILFTMKIRGQVYSRLPCVSILSLAIFPIIDTYDPRYLKSPLISTDAVRRETVVNCVFQG